MKLDANVHTSFYQRVKSRGERWLFNQVHKRNLIYNQCWEDPDVDRIALAIGSKDRIVTITSAGCNTLDYLLSEPASIDCVDSNPHQTALLELKLAAIRQLEFRQFFSMFGEGRISNHRGVYMSKLRPHLTEITRAIWDRHIDYFSENGAGLYYHGTSGWFARMFRFYIDSRPGFRRKLQQFQNFSSIDYQARFYRSEIAPELWSSPLRWLLGQPSVLTMLGVPVEQIRHMKRSGAANVGSVIEERVDRMFTTVPIRNNYFWRVYLNGFYTPDCCPMYLRPQNFELLRNLSDRVQLHTQTLTEFLQSHKGTFSIFVLLDHMDWLASAPLLLQQEWYWILERARTGARIIYRSGGETFDHLPEEARRRLGFDVERARLLNRFDRVGTYGSFYLARVIA